MEIIFLKIKKIYQVYAWIFIINFIIINSGVLHLNESCQKFDVNCQVISQRKKYEVNQN